MDGIKNPLAAGAANSLHRVGERVAVLEERVRAIGTSVDVIRATDHEINGNMQRFVLAEQECRLALTTLAGHITKLTEAMVPLADGVREFQRMHGELLDVVAGYERRRGVATFGKKLGAIVACVVGILTLISMLCVGGFWIMQHIQVHP